MKTLQTKRKLPHRYPMIMLDKVEDVTETTAFGWKNVTMNEPYFRGHFPNAPVMPGVLVMEALCQLVWTWATATSDACCGVRMTGIRKLRFRRPTLPGDRLRLEMELVERKENSCLVKVLASVDGQAALTGNLDFEILTDEIAGNPQF